MSEKDKPDGWDDVGWESYQKIVAGLHSFGEDVEVAEEYSYPRHSVESSDIDVVVWDQSGRYPYTILIECKFHETPVKKRVVDDLVRILHDSDADKGVVVAKSGFQSGAIEAAEGSGVELWTLRPIQPDSDFEGRIRQVDINQTATYPTLTVTDMNLIPVDEENAGKEIDHRFDKHNSRLYTTDRNPTHETLLDRIDEIKQSADEGHHVETFNDRMVLIEGDFYHLDSIEYELELPAATTQMTVDILDDSDLVFINELRDNRQFVSLSDALDMFVEKTTDE